MNTNELEQQWRRWVEKEIGGPEARIETATEAASAAIGQRKNRDEVVMAARQAAVAWDNLNQPLLHDVATARHQFPSTQPQALAVPQSASTLSTAEARRAVKPLWRKMLAVFLGIIALAATLSFISFVSKFRYGDFSPGVAYLVVDLLAIFSVVWLWRAKGALVSGERYSPVATVVKQETLIRGRVIAMQQRQEPTASMPMVVWDLRLQRAGSDKNSLPLVPIEMRSGLGFVGSVAVGDEVEIDVEGYKPGDLICPREIRNLSSNSVVRTR